MLTMQDALLRLIHYWTERGCILMQPFNTEVGAGTLNPATFLRVLGPEPWRTVYVEPSVRPDDSRYGQNPNRLQTHTQLQVILKPEPGDPQDLYLGSLQALGIDIARHDLRFVEDNWESPALGAWGLGWEVWLDGLEITQFTYFQQAGGLPLDPVSVELTYGIERILMALQGARHFKDIEFSDGVRYGEIAGQAEYEMSTYYLDAADVAANRTLFAEYEREARRLLDARLPVPAHTYVLKCSHAFNVLDARQAIGTTERARAFATMRELAHRVAELWVARREELGFPLGLVQAPSLASPKASASPLTEAAEHLLIELGCEELPHADVGAAVAKLERAVPALLEKARLPHGAITVEGTPRRLLVNVAAVGPRQDDVERTVRGPRVTAAFDADGSPTAAATGFARSRNVGIDKLERAIVDGHEHLVLRQSLHGRPTIEVLAEAVPSLLTGITFPRSLRWCAPEASFSRPVRWLVAMLGDGVIPCHAFGVAAGRTTRLLRSAAVTSLAIPAAAAHPQLLADHGIIASSDRRRADVLGAARRLAGEVGGDIDEEQDASVLDEIANLVESPHVLRGSFEMDYLELPAEVLVTVMKKHQRYLPVRNPDGNLLAHFLVAANGAVDDELVRAGNEAVLRARYADAAFFWQHDLATPMAEMHAGLERLVFTEQLGSWRQRAGRVGELALRLGAALSATSDVMSVLHSAAPLLKADLASHMVIEFPNLSGTMGRLYARHAGESAPVADALLDVELPRGAGGTLPGTVAGALLSIAERLDALTGLFGAGMQPRGSNDPFGLRRSALGLLQVTIARQLPLELIAVVDLAAELQPIEVGAQARTDVVNFITRRLEQLLLDEGHAVDLVRAVLIHGSRPALVRDMLAELEEQIDTEPFAVVAEAYRRVLRITGDHRPTAPVDPGRFETDAERGLWDAVAQHQPVSPPGGAPSLESFLERFAPLVAPITRFFDEVMVMAEDQAIRTNRLALLGAVRERGEATIDWSQLRGR